MRDKSVLAASRDVSEASESWDAPARRRVLIIYLTHELYKNTLEVG